MVTMIGERVKELRKQMGLNRTDFAARVGTTRQNIEHLEKGGVDHPRYLPRLLEVLGVTYDELAGRANGTQKSVKFPDTKTRMVSIIPASMAMTWINKETRGQVQITGQKPYVSGGYNTFAVIAEGESMQGGTKPIAPGEVVHCDPDATPADGDIVLAEIISTGAVVLRKLVKAEGQMYLSAQNPHFAPILSDFRILAHAVEKTTSL